MIGFLCEDTVEGIFTGIYEAWESALKEGHENVRVLLKSQYEPELFFDYREVVPDEKKAEKVARSIRKKISPEAFRWVYRSLMSPEADKGDAVYRFLQEGFRHKEKVVSMLGNPAVGQVFALERKVEGEAHRFLEFIRFEQLENGVLFSTIAPKSRVLTLVAPHFEDRFSRENWVIYDETHHTAAVHEALKPYVLTRVSGEAAHVYLSEYRGKDDYIGLWKVFFDAIGIKDRENYRCQRTLLPIWYRKHMTEFL